MGLYIQSLENIPPHAKRDYFIYLLDYGWHEPLGQALKDNYEKMAAIAAKNKAVVIRGTEAVHFEDEVLSWHHINGESAKDLLPAILITNKHPMYFREKESSRAISRDASLKMILIPLGKFCQTTADVISLIHQLFNDVQSGKDLNDFQIAKEKKHGVGKAIVDSLVLEPNFAGIGINIKKLIGWLSK
ncbi:hypothetical protein [Akkermansia glycaniphila]|uniref:Uncharacterized protein n=1 Tax=Akkermansia glycaniphila TaxID=1679444 RepID=A0A1C7PAZ8_9BACT|nr:hypothetical protein [Akkermansia glycaniphila]OCA02737.1 hypothetical protein AC781_08700 [Akkermansia glycaniphila]SEH97322.1 Hypothetical protein PYTT_2205 [Akkermansia glycaniphila]